MTKTFEPHCIKDLRHYLKPLPTTDDLLRLKQYFYYQKNLARRLINYQRLLTSKYIRFNVNKKNLELLPIRSNQNVHINKRQILESEASVTSIDNNNPEPPIKKIGTTVIKLNICSTLIAAGRGIVKILPSSINTDIEALNYSSIDEDISLSKTCKKVFSRSLLRRQIKRKLSNISSFIAPDKQSQNEL